MRPVLCFRIFPFLCFSFLFPFFSPLFSFIWWQGLSEQLRSLILLFFQCGGGDGHCSWGGGGEFTLRSGIRCVPDADAPVKDVAVGCRLLANR